MHQKRQDTTDRAEETITITHTIKDAETTFIRRVRVILTETGQIFCSSFYFDHKIHLIDTVMLTRSA